MAPSVAITTPTPGQAVTAPSITVSGTATDSGSGDNGIASVRVNGVLATGGMATGSAIANWSQTVTLPASNTVLVEAQDGAGNYNAQLITLARDLTGPAVSITSHTSGQTVTTSTIALSGTATDNGRGNSGIASVTVNGAAVPGATTSGSGVANWSTNVSLSSAVNTITVVARDAGNNSTTSRITINRGAANLTLRSSVPSPQQTATSITFTAAASGGIGAQQYKFLVQNGSAAPQVVRNWGSGTTYTWTPNTAANYSVIVWARSSGVTVDAAQASTQMLYVITAPVAIASLRSDVPSPQVTGTPITFTAAATGGTGAYQFKWWLWSGTTWTMVRDWGSAALTWTPSQSNTSYRIGIWVRDASSTADSSQVNLSVPFVINSVPAPSLSIVSSVPSPQIAGTAVTFTAAAAGGAGSYQFKWWLWTGSTWTMLRDWGSSTYTWTSTQASPNYRVGFWARPASSTADSSQFNLSVPFVINAAPAPGWLTLGLTSNLPSPLVVGTPVTFTATATGGSGSYQFKWWLWNGFTWTMIRDWGGATLTWTPSQASPNYRVGVWARDALSTADSNQFNISVPVAVGAARHLSIGLTSDVSGTQQVANTPITFTASAAGGTGSYQFKWWLWDGATWSIVRDWSGATFTWTPTQAGLNYRVGIWVRDASTTADSNDFSLSIATPILP
jgi:hypothetical protein